MLNFLSGLQILYMNQIHNFTMCKANDVSSFCNSLPQIYDKRVCVICVDGQFIIRSMLILYSKKYLPMISYI